MGCCGSDREKNAVVRDEQKWDYVNLDDFRSTSCWTPLAYGYLYFMLLISISVYCVDTFTAVNLLVFDRWSGQIKPVIPLTISRWIYAGCIILSFLLLFYRWLRAIRVMKKGGVAQSYLDPLAVRIQSIRTGRGRGWKRFLVFAELTKSRKGADYVALFTYFSFEAWLRICFAEGPRQVVNAITLYSVMRLNLLPEGSHAATDGHTPIVQFFVNIGVLANTNIEQVVILFGMLWTLVIWVISAISLLVSLILYLVFLWHHVPSADGGLSGYCRRKINRRMERIVKAKVDKALKKENELRARQQAKEGGEFKRQPTLPDVGTVGDAIMPPLSRQTTMTTLPEYSSRPQTTRNSDDSLASLPVSAGPNGRGRPPPPSRGMTHASEASWSSYNSNAPLMDSAGDMGRSVSEPLQTPSSASPSPWNQRPPMRSITGMTQQSQRSFSPGPGTPGAFQMEPLTRSGTGLSSGPPTYSSRTPSESESTRAMPNGRSGSSSQYNPYFPSNPIPSSAGPLTRSPEGMDGRRTPASTTNPYFPPLPNSNGRSSPAPSYRDGPFRGPPPMNNNGRNSPAPSYRSQNPNPTPSSRPYPHTGSQSGRSITPARQPQLPRLQTSDSSTSGVYVAFSPGAQLGNSATPGPQTRGRSSSRPTVPTGASSYARQQTPQSDYPSSGLAPPASNQKHDSVVDILDNY